jgi:hypothetical protein
MLLLGFLPRCATPFGVSFTLEICNTFPTTTFAKHCLYHQRSDQHRHIIAIIMLNLIWVFFPFIFCVMSQTLPGVAPADYADGSFSEPNARHTNYTEGQIIDIEWNSTISRVNIYLITQFDFSKSQILASK